MKKISLIFIPLLFSLIGCENKSVFSSDNRVTHITILYPDSSSVETKITYNDKGSMTSFEETTKKEGRTSVFAIDSVKYDPLTGVVIMYDRNDKRIFTYTITNGYALNCNVTSATGGSRSAAFYYKFDHLVTILETSSLSFSNNPDSIFGMQYENKSSLVAFTDRYNSYKLTSSQTKNENNLLLAPIHYGIYTPAYYAGIMGKSPLFLFSSATNNKTTSTYSYLEEGKNTTIELINEKGEKTVYRYTLL